MATLTKMDKAQARVMIYHRFYGACIASTPIIRDDKIPTACTDMLRIYYNHDFIEGLSTSAVVEFVFCHEVMHIILKHSLRQKGRHHRLWNVACDYVINWLLKSEGMTLWEHALIDDRFADMSEEEVYAYMLDDAQRNRHPGQQGQQSQQGQQGQQGQASGGAPSLEDIAADTWGGAGGMEGDIRELPPMDEATRAEIDYQVTQRITQAAISARMCGKYSAALARMIDGLLTPQVDWAERLRRFMMQFAKTDQSWARRNRRVLGTFLPALHSEAMGEIVVIGDTSGSITGEELNQLASEVSAIAEVVKPERIRVVWADAQVCLEQVFEQGETLVLTPQGGGGTDMRVPLEHIEQYDPMVAILVTDGYTPWPDSVPYPLIVCCTTNRHVPVGDEVVRIR